MSVKFYTCVIVAKVHFLVINSLCSPLQLLSEKISGAEGTKLDDEFMEMERVSSVCVCL